MLVDDRFRRKERPSGIVAVQLMMIAELPPAPCRSPLPRSMYHCLIHRSGDDTQPAQDAFGPSSPKLPLWSTEEKQLAQRFPSEQADSLDSACRRERSFPRLRKTCRCAAMGPERTMSACLEAMRVLIVQWGGRR